jgi:acyl carrier protein
MSMNERFTSAVIPHLKFLDGRTLTAESSLPELGLDSMQAIDLLFDLEDAFGVPLPDDELSDTTFATAGNLWSAVVRATGTEES